MTREEALYHLIDQAQTNGFDLRRWFLHNIAGEWPGSEQAIQLLAGDSRFYALIFSHDFARAFWQKGAQMNFIVPAATYSRLNGKGQVVTINRKPFTRRTIKADVWKYHLRQMALSEEPLRYLNRFLPSHEEMECPSADANSLCVAG
ncbi:MAG TPA: hypothetical protein VHZ52_14395 [Acidobacteriaceae bacterium]|jgi:hypothetical protein|nr:hypothetical protein [Acidobacteriaceae bacterium]